MMARIGNGWKGFIVRLGRRQLNHPNVVTLYSVEESEGVHFLTMEFVDGQPLHKLIRTEGLPADDSCR